MNEFDTNCKSIKEISIEELREQYINLLREHQQHLNEIITKLFPEESNIKKTIDDQLMIEFKWNGIDTINKLSEDLDELIELLINKIYDKEPEKKELFSLYIDRLKIIIKKNQLEWIDNKIEDFADVLIKITKETLNSPEQNKIIIKKIKEQMKEYRNKFIQDYNEIQKDFVNKIVSQISLLINEIDFINLRTSEYKKFSELLNLCNFELTEDNRIFYARDKKNNEKKELYLDKGTLNSKDNKLKFIIDDEKSTKGFINSETTQSIVIRKEDNSVEKINLISIKDNTIITIYKLEGTYNFEKNLKLVTDIKEIKSILNEIRKDYPGVLNKMLRDKDIKPIVEKIKEYNDSVLKMKEKRNDKKLIEQDSNLTNLSKQDKTKKKI